MTDQQKAELAALAAMSDDEIDTSDIPEVTDWSNAKRGVIYRLTKQRITLDLDAEVIAWFKSNAQTDIDCQTLINLVLREHVRREKARNPASP
ncbi:MAG: BrnA antitoxin family protein [Chloroflexota bacterium]|nr:BrnA antitoxin family protein [Chloroflexota bacterium]MDE2958470.1 BrnA antitoxin family protein [Chloroflexota bacterium]